MADGEFVGEVPEPLASPPAPAPVSAFATLALNCLVLFIAESTRGLVLPTLNSYAGRLAGDDGSAGGSALAVSVFSAGRLVAAPALGALADAVPFRTLFFACSALSVAGHALYVGAAALPTGPGAVAALVASRFVLGVASGVLGPCRAVVSVLTPPKSRTRAFAALSTAKFFGYAILPFAGTIGVPAVRVGGVPIDRLNAPGVVLAAANAALALVVLLCFDARVTSGYKPPFAAAKGKGKGKGDADGAAVTPLLADVPAVAGDADGAAVTPLLADVPAVAVSAQCADSQCAPPAAGAGASVNSCDDNGGGDGGGGAPGARVRPPPTLDYPTALGVALFLFLNVLGKGILTQLEVFLAYLYQEVVTGPRHEDAAALWLGYLGLAGLLTFAYLSVRARGAWPPEVVLLALALAATGAGAALLAEVEAARGAPAAPVLLNVGAVLAWSIGAPVTDVLTTSLFSVVVDGRAAGKWLGLLTMSGSVGRILLPLTITALGLRAALLVSAAGAALAVAALAAYAGRAALAAALRPCCARAGGARIVTAFRRRTRGEGEAQRHNLQDVRDPFLPVHNPQDVRVPFLPGSG